MLPLSFIPVIVFLTLVYFRAEMTSSENFPLTIYFRDSNNYKTANFIGLKPLLQLVIYFSVFGKNPGDKTHFEQSYSWRILLRIEKAI